MNILLIKVLYTSNIFSNIINLLLLDITLSFRKFNGLKIT